MTDFCGDDHETSRYLASYIANYYGTADGELDKDKLYELIKEFYDNLP